MQLPYLPEANGWSWQHWAAFLQDPLQYKLPELKQAARQLRMPVQGSKALLTVSTLQAFGLNEPSRVSPQLLRAVLLERCCANPWVGCEDVGRVWHALSALLRLNPGGLECKWPGLGQAVLDECSGMTAAARRSVLSRYTGACSKQQLRQLVVELRQQQERIHEQQRRNAETQRPRLALESASDAAERTDAHTVGS
jgi:hypothetical protein